MKKLEKNFFLKKLVRLTVRMMMMSTEITGPRVDTFDRWRVLMGDFYIVKNIYVV